LDYSVLRLTSSAFKDLPDFFTPHPDPYALPVQWTQPEREVPEGSADLSLVSGLFADTRDDHDLATMLTLVNRDSLFYRIYSRFIKRRDRVDRPIQCRTEVQQALTGLKYDKPDAETVEVSAMCALFAGREQKHQFGSDFWIGKVLKVYTLEQKRRPDHPKCSGTPAEFQVLEFH
jgi:hypothetical protein